MIIKRLMEVTIDPNSGFCFGVKHTIEKADSYLEEFGNLSCLGEIVHNQEEMKRLSQKGLTVIDQSDFEKRRSEKILIRAHGEPPQTYETARKNHIELLDTTCPIVLKLQQKIKDAREKMKWVEGNIVIFGKRSHPEVIGLLGNSDNAAIIIENVSDIEKLDFSKPMHLFAQTTMSNSLYQELADLIKEKYNAFPDRFKFHKSVCGQVANRVPELEIFAKNHDVIIFVSGEKSSNGKLLFEVCKKENPNSFKVSSVEELKEDWFYQVSSVGISGATSTPNWLMKQISERINSF
jgi:4-hydroxy-3-methylbut-2-enyl diphosphate reductase